MEKVGGNFWANGIWHQIDGADEWNGIALHLDEAVGWGKCGRILRTTSYFTEVQCMSLQMFRDFVFSLCSWYFICVKFQSLLFNTQTFWTFIYMDNFVKRVRFNFNSNPANYYFSASTPKSHQLKWLIINVLLVHPSL